MANPYPALITDANSETRVAGQINFTDPANQPGGGSSLLEQSVTSITDAQWKALPVATLEVVPAPGPGKVIYCPAVHGAGFAVIAFDWHVDYTNVDASAQVYFELGTNAGQTNYTMPTAFLSWGAPVIWPIVVSDAGAHNEATNNTTDLVNKPVLMGILNGGLGAFTDGDAANSFTVTVAYYVYNA